MVKSDMDLKLAPGGARMTITSGLRLHKHAYYQSVDVCTKFTVSDFTRVVAANDI